MSKYKVEFFTGIFFIIGLTCLFILIFKISTTWAVYDIGNKYRLKAIFKNVGNLKFKSKVTIYGVKVGYVSNIRLFKNDAGEYDVEVEMLISSFIDSIPIDSIVNIFMTSLLGEHYVQIELGNEDVFLKHDDVMVLTTPALIIEDLISKFAFK